MSHSAPIGRERSIDPHPTSLDGNPYLANKGNAGIKPNAIRDNACDTQPVHALCHDMHTRDVHLEPQYNVQGQHHYQEQYDRFVRGEACSFRRVDNGVGVNPLDIDSGDEPPSSIDHARRKVFTKNDAQ